MESLKFLAGGAAFGIIASCWNSIKAYIWRICNLFLEDVYPFDNGTKNNILAYLLDHYKVMGMYDSVYSTIPGPIRSVRKHGIYSAELFGDKPLIFRRGWKIIYFNPGGGGRNSNQGGNSNQLGGNTSNNQREDGSYFIFIRGMIDFKDITKQTCDYINNYHWNSLKDKYGSRFNIVHLPKQDNFGKNMEGISGWDKVGTIKLIGITPEELGWQESKTSLLDRLFFPDEIVNLIKEIKIWKNSKEFYEELGVPWKRGWLLYGPGGTGKTALASAFAQDLDMPIFIFNLVDMSNTGFKSHWQQCLLNAPCIVLIEDIDNVFHGRTNIHKTNFPDFGGMFKDKNTHQDSSDEHEQPRSSLINFDTFLNCIDGVERAEGIFLIITTNQIEHIDAALGRPVDDGTNNFTSTRPGRIDRVIELKTMEPYVKKKMARYILAKFPDQLEAMLYDIEANPIEETPAQFQNRCVQIALKAFWDQQYNRSHRSNGHHQALTLGGKS